jgi:hypothetical protein
MIISHQHKFIFLKTAKTAGSAIEAALAPRCGPDDILTGNCLDTHRRNYQLGLGKLGIRIPGEIARRLPEVSGFYPHMPAHQVRRLISKETWNGYFKFTVERNPWDRQVSAFFYRHEAKLGNVDFATYLTERRHALLHSIRIRNWDVYTIDGSIVVDAVMRYETLAEDFARIWQQIGLGGKSRLQRVNVGPRPDRGHYRAYYDERTRQLIADWYANEIRAFGYEF